MDANIVSAQVETWVGHVTLINKNGVRFGGIKLNPHTMEEIMAANLHDYYTFYNHLRTLYSADQSYGVAYAEMIARIHVMWIKQPVVNEPIVPPLLIA